MRQMQSEGLEDSYDLLTDREKEVLRLLAEGKSNKEAASLLSVSLYTIETHRSRLMQKLNLRSPPTSCSTPSVSESFSNER